MAYAEQIKICHGMASKRASMLSDGTTGTCKKFIYELPRRRQSVVKCKLLRTCLGGSSTVTKQSASTDVGGGVWDELSHLCFPWQRRRRSKVVARRGSHRDGGRT